MNADYKLVDAGKVYSDIHKVKVRPATGVHLPLEDNLYKCNEM